MLSVTEHEILKQIDEKEIIGFLQKLVRSNSENPPGNENETALLIADELKSFGCSVELQEVEDNRPNVIGVLEGNNKDKILFNGHTDTVKIGDSRDWDYPPLGAEIHDGVLHGRGSVDMKAGIVSMIFAMKALKKSGMTFENGIMFTGVIDEEVSFKGTQALIRDNKLNDCRLGFVSEPTGLDIVIRQKGGLEYTALTFGKAAHSGQAFLGENAINRMGKVIAGLEDYDKDLRSRMDIPFFRYPTVNIGTISGGTGVTFVPNSCQIEFDRQVFPVENINTVNDEVLSVIDQIRNEHGIQIDLTEVQSFNPWEISEESPVVIKLKTSFQKLFNQQAKISGMNGYCEVELLEKAGIPSVVFGPGDDATSHTVKECVVLQEVIDATRVYALLAYDYVSGPGSKMLIRKR